MSESSLDSELLAVAGAKKSAKKRKALSESEEEEVSSEDVSLDDESDWEETRATSKKRGGSSSKLPARKRQARWRGAPTASESEEEGEAAAEESEDEDRLEIDEEDLIEDEEDRKRLAAMTELQREYELANRAEKRNQELLRQKLLAKNDAKAERAGANAAKRVGRSKSGREEREEAAKKSAMEELKAARERKARGAEERARKRDESEELEEEEEEEERVCGRRAAREPSEEGALESEDELSDDDRQRDLYGHRRMEEGEDEEDEAPLEEVKKIQVRREKLEQWVNEPFFEDTLPGCMVRVVAGEMPGLDNMPMKRYMLCQVVTVETRAPGYYKDSGQTWRSPYAFGPSNEKTHKWLLVERGNSQRGMPLAQVSNTGFTQYEFESWQRALKDQGRPQVSRRTVKDTYERLVKANAYTYTAEDVARLLQEKKAKGVAPHNIALEKARLGAQLSYAKEHGEDDKAAELEAQIAQLDMGLDEGKGKRHKHNMADLNKRNADMNFKNALDNVSNKVGAAAGAQDARASQLDPFSRRATRPMIYWSTKRQQQDEEQAASQEPDAAASGDAEAAEARPQQEQQHQKRRPDLDAIVDLSSLDLSILERPARMSPMARNLLGPTWRPAPPPPGARIISFNEYKRSKGWA